MKKNFTRALSLLLVLVMILGAMPMAMATEQTPAVPTTVTVIPDKTTNSKVGDTVKFSVTAPPGYTASNYAWSGATGDGATATLVCSTAGSITVSVNVQLTSDSDATATGAASGSVTITVAPVATGLEIKGANTTTATENLQLTAVATPEGAALPGTVYWTSSDTTVATVNHGLVVPRKVGVVTIFATCGELTASHAVEITNVVVTPTVTPSSLTLDPGKTGSIGGTYSPASAAQYIDTTMTSKNTAIATVNANTGAVTAVSAGTTAITVKGTIKSSAPTYVRFANGATTWEVDIPVTVSNKARIGNISNQSAVVGSSIVLNPILYDWYDQPITATFTAVATGCTLTQSGKSWIASSNTSGVATVIFTATYTEGSETKTLSKTVTLGFYKSTTLNVTLKEGITSFRFEEKGLFQSASVGNQDYMDLTNLSMTDLLDNAMDIPSATTINRYTLSDFGSNGGYLSHYSVSVNNVNAVSFRQNSSFIPTSTFIISAISGNTTDGIVVGMLELEINYPTNKIEYNTTGVRPITVAVEDFLQVWEEANTTNSHLRYITFDSNNPLCGALYTSQKKTLQVNTTMRFGLGSDNPYYPLDGVTYVPDAVYEPSYTVNIPFIMYGTKNSTVSGHLTIHVNSDETAIAWGYCGGKGDGSNLTWVIDKEGVLTVAGMGDMAGYPSGSNVPWYENRDAIKKIVIGDDVTAIGSYAFYDCKNLTTVTVGKAVKTIGNHAFYESTKLTEVYFNGNAPTVGNRAFETEPVTLYYIPGTTGWTGSTWNGYRLEIRRDYRKIDLTLQDSGIAVLACAGEPCQVLVAAYDANGQFVECEIRKMDAGTSEWVADVQGLSTCQLKVFLLEDDAGATPWASLCPVAEYTGK